MEVLNMRLRDIVDGLEIIEIKGSLDIEIKGISYDSRTVGKDYLFICKGYGFNKKFISDAVENGAAAVLMDIDADVPEGVVMIKVKDARYALAHTADNFYGHPSKKLKLIGVTGTKGKTTTTYMVKSILDNAGMKTGLIGTIQNMIGDEVLYTERTTPESLDLQALFSEMHEKSVDTVIMEVSSQGIELHRVSCCDFDIGVFTNISPDHIGPKEHATFEDYLNAKLKLFKLCKKGLVNMDCEYAQKALSVASCEMLTFGIDNEADIRALNIKKMPNGTEFDVITPWFKDRIKTNTLGRFNIYNVLAAIGVCGFLGIDADRIKEGLKNITVKGRMEVVQTGTDYTVIIDYAHNAVSLENLLNTVREFAEGRVICLFGCGGDRDKSRRFEMGEVSGKLSDLTIITSDNPRTEDPEAIINDIETGIKKTEGKYIKITDRKEAIEYALRIARTGDVIILAGKGHELYQMFGDKTIHFDEREIVSDILLKIGK